MNKLCKCGCGKKILSNKIYYYMHAPQAQILSIKFKGKKYEDILGKNKASLKKKNMSKSMKGKNKDKQAWNKGIPNISKGKKYGTLEERFGKSIALVKRIKNSNRQKNRTLEENIIKVNKEQNTKIKKGLMKSDTQLIQLIKDENKNFTRTELRLFLPISDKRIQKMGGIEVIANQANIKLKVPIRNRRNNRLGNNEKLILNYKEKELGLKLIRQYQVNGKFIDGYDPINNIAYEVDEIGHKNQQVQDFLREQEIENVLGCSFIRINEQQFLNKIRNRTMVEFIT